MRAQAVGARVNEPGSTETTAASIAVAADFCPRGPGRGASQSQRLRLDHEGARWLEPTHQHRVRVLWAASAAVVLGEAVLAARHDPGLARECLIVQLGVLDGPIEVLAGQHLTAKLVIIHYPCRSLVAVGCVEDGGLIGP